MERFDPYWKWCEENIKIIITASEREKERKTPNGLVI